MVFFRLNLGQHKTQSEKLISPHPEQGPTFQETLCSFLKSDFYHLSAVGPQLSVVAGIPGITHPSTDSRQPSGGQTELQAFYRVSPADASLAGQYLLDNVRRNFKLILTSISLASLTAQLTFQTKNR